jgi:hypothetical protein
VPRLRIPLEILRTRKDRKIVMNSKWAFNRESLDKNRSEAIDEYINPDERSDPAPVLTPKAHPDQVEIQKPI